MKISNSISLTTGVLALTLACFGPTVALGHHEHKLLVAANDAAQPAAEAPKAEAPKVKVESGNPQTGDADAIKVGTRLYFTWCVQCHGLKANGESRFGAYAGDLTRFWRGYKDFIKIVKDGRTGNLGMMPAWKEYMDEETIGKIGAFLETLAVEGANWK